MPQDLYDELRVIALVSGVDVQTHLQSALRDYLAEGGHRAAVAGFARRARSRHRAALELLVDRSPSRSTP